jgi:ATP/maltotriose-dependent transcriptional regulator MalT
MNQFYLGTSIFGILLIIGTLVVILFDKKKSLDYASKMEEEKNELIKVIADSEQMLEELNRFSDYVISQVEKKSTQLAALLRQCDEELPKQATDVQGENPLEIKEPAVSAGVAKGEEPKRSKTELTNTRHKDVLELVERGMSDTEIAKALNMGKGEVQLILGMNIHKLKTGI